MATSIELDHFLIDRDKLFNDGGARPTGTVVGIVSFGVQVCKAGYNYYFQFCSFSNDVNKTVLKIKSLRTGIELLRLVTGTLGFFEQRQMMHYTMPFRISTAG